MALAPVMLPGFVPIVQEKLLAALAVSEILELAPLQMLVVDEFVTAGIGFTVTVIV